LPCNLIHSNYFLGIVHCLHLLVALKPQRTLPAEKGSLTTEVTAEMTSEVEIETIVGQETMIAEEMIMPTPTIDGDLVEVKDGDLVEVKDGDLVEVEDGDLVEVKDGDLVEGGDLVEVKDETSTEEDLLEAREVSAEDLLEASQVITAEDPAVVEVVELLL
jgi:hypothetical protein